MPALKDLGNRLGHDHADGFQPAVLEDRLSQAPLSFPILPVSRYYSVSDERPELVPDRALHVYVLGIDEDVSNVVRVAELFDMDIAHPIPHHIAEQLLARCKQPQRIFSSFLQMPD